ncbi:MAG: STAS/SEC14 domain-containing protein [Mycolicibacterium sp.]|nr:STAS/SEC14 domain-containing protein [Mycolicibacterium sp.]
MLEPLPNMPDGVIGLRAVGTVEPADYTSVLDPAVDARAATGEKVNMVYLVGDEFDHYSLGGLWEDAKLGLRDPRVWGRVAVVTNHDWLRRSVAIFRPIMGGHARLFDVDQLDEATAWAAGQD